MYGTHVEANKLWQLQIAGKPDAVDNGVAHRHVMIHCTFASRGFAEEA